MWNYLPTVDSALVVENDIWILLVAQVDFCRIKSVWKLSLHKNFHKITPSYVTELATLNYLTDSTLDTWLTKQFKFSKNFLFSCPTNLNRLVETFVKTIWWVVQRLYSFVKLSSFVSYGFAVFCENCYLQEPYVGLPD